MKGNLKLIIVSIVAGLLGGLLSNLFVAGSSLYAQGKQSIPKVIEAEEFRVVNKNGDVIAKLGHEGFVRGLIIYGLNGKRRIVLGDYDAASNQLYGMSLLDDQENIRSIYARNKSGVSLEMTGGNNLKPKKLLTLELDSEGGGLFITTPNGKAEAKIMAYGDTGGMVIQQAGEGPGAALTISQDRTLELALWDRHGEKARAVLALSRNGYPYQKFTNENGQVIWSAP